MATIYVGSGGNDTNAGTSYATRFLTLSKAATTVSAGGDIVYVSPGTYRELLTVSVSGGNAYTTGTVTVTNGSTTVTGSGTTFTGGNVVAGYYFKTRKSAPILISAVNSATEIILASAYDGPTEAGIVYTTYNPIKWIGDYSGANTDGVGGVIRVTGSSDDISATRANCLTSTSKSYNHFTAMTFDTTTSYNISLTSCTHFWFNKIFMAGTGANLACASIAGSGQLAVSFSNCYGKDSQGTGGVIYYNHSSVVDNAQHMVQNCILTGGIFGAIHAGVCSSRVGGVIVKNSFISDMNDGIRVQTALTAGQYMYAYNNIITRCSNGVAATTTAEFDEDFNNFYKNSTDRSNVNVGANSVGYPLLLDTRWFFEATK